MLKTLFAAGFALCTISFALPAQAQKPSEDIPKFAQVEDGIYRGGQPTLAGLERLKAMGVKTIINLRTKEHEVDMEEAEVRKLGLNFVRIPIYGLRKPRTSEVSKFLSLAQDPQAKPLFVHCMEGVDRTGTLVAIYRQKVDKWNANDAYREMKENGFHKQYAWFADTVFDWADKSAANNNRPLSIKLFGTMPGALIFRKDTAQG